MDERRCGMKLCPLHQFSQTPSVLRDPESGLETALLFSKSSGLTMVPILCTPATAACDQKPLDREVLRPRPGLGHLPHGGPGCQLPQAGRIAGGRYLQQVCGRARWPYLLGSAMGTCSRGCMCMSHCKQPEAYRRSVVRHIKSWSGDEGRPQSVRACVLVCVRVCMCMCTCVCVCVRAIASCGCCCVYRTGS